MIRAALAGLLLAAGCQGASVMAGPRPEPADDRGDECQGDEDCDDGDPCNGTETCSAGECRAGWATSCDDADPCTDDRCDPFDGSCVSTPSAGCGEPQDCSTLAPGDEVDDGSACNGVEVCAQDGGMVSGTAVDCDDGDPCTTDECLEPTGSCLHTEVPSCEAEPFEEEPGAVVEVEGCDDGLDDDGDGWVDCEDSDCSEKPACTGGGEGEEEEPEPEGEVCDDETDNDGDLAIDCYDRDCLGDAAC